MKLFDNRFVRLAVAAISQIIILALIMSFIDSSFSANVMTFWITSYVIGIVGVVLFDLMDIKFLNKTTGRIIKLVLFYLFFVILLSANIGTDSRGFEKIVEKYTSGIYDGEYLKAQMGMGYAMLTSMAGSSFPLVAAAVTIFARKDFLEEPRYPLVFAVAEGLGVSTILGLLLGFAYKGGIDFNGLYILSIIIGMVILVIVTVFFGLPFEYDYKSDWWNLKNVLFRPKRHSYSSSNSNSTRRNTTRTYTTTSSSGGDRRKNGNGALSARMSSIASSASKSEGVSYYSRVDFRVSSSVGPGRIKFTISGKIHYSNSVKTQAEVDVVRNDVRRATEELANRLKSEAQYAVSELREKYKDYDGAYSIHIAMN